MAAITIFSDFGAPKNKSQPLFPLFPLRHVVTEAFSKFSKFAIILFWLPGMCVWVLSRVGLFETHGL